MIIDKLSLISLATSGNLDASFLIPLQVYQGMILGLVKETLMAAILPARLAYDPDKETYVYAYEAIEGCIA